MFKGISLVAIAFLVVGCASSGTEDSASAEDDVKITKKEGSAITVVDDKDAVSVAVTPAAAAATDPNEVVCRRETPTGSRMSYRVCRTRAEIEERSEKDQESLRNSRALQSGGDCALNQNC